jgi:hypothetical protein
MTGDRQAVLRHRIGTLQNAAIMPEDHGLRSGGASARGTCSLSPGLTGRVCPLRGCGRCAAPITFDEGQNRLERGYVTRIAGA